MSESKPSLLMNPWMSSGRVGVVSLLALTISVAGCNNGIPSDGAGAYPGERAVAAPDSLADWSAAFEAEGATGTFVLYNVRTGQTVRHNPERAATRFTPASTSKVFNALVFLDQGVVTDPDSMFAWDGVERWADVWNQDHSLRSGVRYSAVWLFQRLAQEVGPDGYDEVFARQSYGNSFMGDTLHMAWLNGSLRISADEQIVFLNDLRHGRLAFSAEDQATVRDLMPVLAEGDGWTLEGKTGWGLRSNAPDIGWIVGWVTRPEGDFIYAMNAEEAPGQSFDLMRGRLRIVRPILEAEGIIPPEDDETSG